MKGIKRFSSGLLAALIVISMLPMAAVESSAAVSAPSSATVLAQRMNAVKSGTYGVGKYFTTNGTACVGHNRCKTPTAAEAGVAGAKQCFGYARYVFYQLFGLSLSTQYYGSKRYELADLGNIKQVGQRASSTVSATATKEILTKAYMGDVIQASQTPTTKQHTMIVNSVSSTGVTVLECNWDDVCDIDLRTNAITLEVQNCTLTITDKKTGDVNGDGKLSAIDARFALQSAAGNRELTTQAAKAADVNGDGKVTAIDARWILQAAAGNRVL